MSPRAHAAVIVALAIGSVAITWWWSPEQQRSRRKERRRALERRELELRAALVREAQAQLLAVTKPALA